MNRSWVLLLPEQIRGYITIWFNFNYEGEVAGN